MSEIKCKKPTNKDVAAFAGVSVATVSYVVNGRTDKRIPEATQKKVLHAINFLGYVPNPHATAIKSSVKDITVIGAKSATSLQTAETILTLKKLTESCAEKGYTVNFSVDNKPRRMTATACILIGVTGDCFYSFANENFMPLVAVDALIGDPIFFQVTVDYEKVRNAAEKEFKGDYVFVAVFPENDALRNQILSVMPNTFFVKDFCDLKGLPDNNLVTCDCVLKELLGDRIQLFSDNDDKIAAVIDCVEKAANRIVSSENEHFKKV